MACGYYTLSGISVPLPLYSMGSEADAIDWLERAMTVFDVPPIDFIWKSGQCSNLLGCYQPMFNRIGLNPDGNRIPMYVVAHEFGHALEKAMSGSAEECKSYQQCEGFARYFESIYMTTNGQLLDFVCDCGATHLRVLPDQSLQCVDCGTEYYAPLFNPIMYNGTYQEKVPPTGYANLGYGEVRGQPTAAASTWGPAATTAVCHLAVGALFALAPAALKPGDGKLVKDVVLGGEALIAFKEAVFDPLVFGQTLGDAFYDFLVYNAGIMGGMVALKATGHEVWG